MDREAINKKLRKYYEFTDDDLYANNMNRLSSAQENRLKMLGQVQRKGGFIITTFFFGLGLCLGSIGFFILLISLINQDWKYSTSIGPLIYTFVPAFFLTAIGGFMLWSTLCTGGVKGKLFRASGPVTLRVEVHTGGDEHHQKYKVHYVKFPDGSEFSFEDTLLDCIKDGEEYLAHYYLYDNGSGGLVFTMEKL
jgi:polyferredoxin